MLHLSARTIAIARRNGSAMLTDTCSLFRASGATGTMGEPLGTLELVTSGVRCRVIRAKTPANSSQQVVGSQESLVEAYRLECPYDTTFTVDMVAQLDSDSSRWQVVQVEDKLTDSVFAAAVITRVRA